MFGLPFGLPPRPFGLPANLAREGARSGRAPLPTGPCAWSDACPFDLRPLGLGASRAGPSLVGSQRPSSAGLASTRAVWAFGAPPRPPRGCSLPQLSLFRRPPPAPPPPPPPPRPLGCLRFGLRVSTPGTRSQRRPE